ncbi:two-component system LytT family response regulator [Catalinimonas alkaloidigena]|uniref:LytR/AlgR family response regulator transcription factor n=1 Tax=Catalinimonas alkaloidigena TaxID=1075417 RepID=UPI0024049288|nr:LytTR family DNA-binding domain-containing protein [Catalinimonas alkaloidigena]MDF9799299.1 two-component system LytT family response regulator [Catalinimonas alkaloidigena]
MKIKCLIVDDEYLALDLLEGYIKKTPFLQLVGRCPSAIDALAIMEDQTIDLLFLDIQMSELNGIELSRTLIHGPKVIFTTAFEEYALEGFKVSALDYLLKPINYEEFLTAAHKAKQWFERQSAPMPPSPDEAFIFVKSEYKIKKIPLDQLLYVEGLKDYVKIFMADQSSPIMSLISMKAIEEKLPSHQFLRVHRSFIVNMNQVHTVERSRIVFGTIYIPVSEKYKAPFQDFITRRFLS